MKSRDTNDWTTYICMKTRGEIRYSGRVNISCSACSTRHDVPYVVSRNENTHDNNIMAYRCHSPWWSLRLAYWNTGSYHLFEFVSGSGNIKTQAGNMNPYSPPKCQIYDGVLTLIFQSG